MAAERFRFPDAVLRVAARRTLRRLAVTLVAAAAAVVALWATALRPEGAGAGTLAFALAFLAALAAVSTRRRLRRLQARWGSFEVRIEDDAVVREVTGFRSVRIARDEVAAVEERAEGILVRARGGAALLVPREVEGYALARERLAA